MGGLEAVEFVLAPVRRSAAGVGLNIIGGVSAASEATLSSCPLRFGLYVGRFSTCNQSLRR